MSLRRCIPDLQGEGSLNPEQAARLSNLFDELEREYSTRFSKQTAEAMASEEAVRRFEADAFHRRRQALLQIKAQQQIAFDTRSFRGDNPTAAATALFTADSRAPYANVERISDMVEGQAHSMMSGVLAEFRRNLAGKVRNGATLENVVREAFGQATGDLSARELAQAWGRTAEMLRTRFNAAGGGVGKLENWGMPQVHNPVAVAAKSFEEWRDFIAPLLDRQKMRDISGDPMTPQQLEMALRGAYETIVSEGWNKREAGAFTGAGKTANRHADQRFLIFKDADAWMAYNRQFGRPQSAFTEALDPDGPIFDAMMGHIGGMARDIAMLERFGPNPAATLRWLKDGLEMEARQPKHQGIARRRAAEKALPRLDALYGEVSGANHRVADVTLANVGQAVRSFQVASKLGSAMLSAVSDVGFQHVTAKMNGLSSAHIVRNYAALLNPASAKDRALASRLWMINENATRMATAGSRYSGEAFNGEITGRMAESVLRASGLNAWTQAGRWAFGMEFWSHITSEAGHQWDGLNPAFRRQLERYGFSPAEWDAIRATPLEEGDGTGKWILPENFADRALAERVAMMIATETDYAVPTASLRVTAAMNASLRRGEWLGEIGRSMMLFKSFPLTVMWMHGRRTAELGWRGGASYAARLAITTTALGALAMQLRNVAAGKDAQPMDNEEFWYKSFAQGGGAGVLGDFIGQQTNRFEQSLAEWAAGPVFSSGQDAYKLIKESIAAEIGVDAGTATSRSRKAKALRRFVQGNTPGSSLWYIKLAFQREILDQMQAEMDPDYWDSFDRMEQRAREDGTEFYWRPGEAKPDRAPQVSN